MNDNSAENLRNKEIIASVVIGSLDKSYNKAQRAYLYDSLDIAEYHQEQGGGHIGLFQKIREIIVLAIIAKITKSFERSVVGFKIIIKCN